MSDALSVYTGAWVNWSHGLVLGATVTLPQEYAGLLTAFLAIFVSFAGTMMWRILCFLIHQAYTTRPSESRDFLHHTRQVILRNSGSGGAAAWSFTWLAWTAGRKAPRALLRIVPLILLALLNVALFGISGVFSAYVTKVPGNTTIVLGPHCGGFDLSTKSLIQNSIFLSKTLEDTKQAATYANQCYQGSSSLACGTYVRQSIPFTTNPNASCPFEKGLCNPTDQSAFAMDTGFLDSHEDFGINASPENRVKFRRLTTCSPIYGSDFVTNRNDSYGRGLVVEVNAGLTPAMVKIGNNWTFSYIDRLATDGVSGYTLQAIQSQADPTGALHSAGNMWYPDPRLNTTDADITLMMLAQNDIYYATPSDDPWIPAHNELNGTETYIRDYRVNLLGCIDQYQFCNPNVPGDAGCSKVAGIQSVYKDMLARFPTLKWNVAQVTAIGRFLSMAPLRTMFYAVHGRGDSALNIAQKLYNGIQYGVPATQWQIEVSSWFALSLAKEQAWAVEWATSPVNFAPRTTDEEQPWSYSPATDESGQYQCRNQLVHNSGEYKSLSLLGVGVILGVGGVIILLGLFLDILVGFFQRGKRKYLREQWETEEILGLHKSSYRALGVSTNWADEVPPSSVFQGLSPPGPGEYQSVPLDGASQVGKSDGGILVSEQHGINRGASA
ncbi:hypothetical protein BBP40_012458 [Aspergillus hancockii]|nr:hypothetical protein BBP40_012458 [Aspergillus hancockii]